MSSINETATYVMISIFLIFFSRTEKLLIVTNVINKIK